LNRILFINIGLLVNTNSSANLVRGKDLADLPSIENAFLLIEEGRIAEFGPMYELELKLPHPIPNTEDLHGRIVMPAWCDSHTHAVFAGSRENEFLDKLKGLTYEEIAAKGGGILNSAARLRDTSEEMLYTAAKKRLKELAMLGTGSVEIKSGYGLTLESELKMLRVIKRLKQDSDQLIKATFLGAHAYPSGFKQDHEGYLSLLINEMLPAIAEEKLADYIDVFCEKGFFSAGETDRILTAASQYYLRPKLHVNQLSSAGGIEVGIRHGALSLDHLETLNEAEIKMLGEFKGASTLLPTAAFFLRMNYQPARDLINAGAAVTLASDMNPGSSPSGNMNFVTALSCIQMRMLPEEVINAATLNGAAAMELAHETGSISIGKRADLIITKKIPSLTYLFYSFGDNHIEKVMLNGKWQENHV